MKNMIIDTFKFNDIAENVNLLNKLRSLTVAPYSVMNHERMHLESKADQNEYVDCDILVAKINKKLVASARLSREPSNFLFLNTDGYQPSQGALFQVFVDPEYRRQGIGSKLIEKAKQMSLNSALCIAPWDYAS